MKLFVTSDIHGYFDEFKKALDEAGFDCKNKEHFLLTLGDHFDRGRQPEEVMKYLMSLERWIGVKGNHEELLLNCVDRGYWYSHDISNGTMQTICDLAPNAQTFDVACSVAYEKTKDFMSKLFDYFETKKYIFVHSWIPLIIEDDYPKYYTRDREYHFNPNWRNATEKEWNEARWGNPFKIAEQGLNQTGKTVTFGHWHCSTGWAKAEGRTEFGANAKFEPFYGDGFISIDACTAHSKKCNVIVLEDDFLQKSTYKRFNSYNISKKNNIQTSSSGFIGVYLDKRNGHWWAEITKNGLKTRLGTFTEKEEAVKVRLQTEKEYFGKFAPQRHLFKEYGIEDDFSKEK